MSMHVMIVDPGRRLPSGTSEFLSRKGWKVSTFPQYIRAAAQLCSDDFDAFVCTAPSSGSNPEAIAQFSHLLRLAESRNVGGVVLKDPSTNVPKLVPALVQQVSPTIQGDEILDCLAPVIGYRTLIRGMERELDRLQRLGNRLKEHFLEIDQEMRLAGRLQRDFLPRDLQPIGPARFATVFRPASWVSGDIYDVFRVDENHVGFYIADAVGHGMAASLLTMFLKRAVVSKRIEGNSYQILEPSETLALLNEALTTQELPNCQFVTACYCLLNQTSLELRYARGGHTHPIHVKNDGTYDELKVEGPLLGLFKGEAFETGSTNLAAGDKIILYSDGIETAIPALDGARSHANPVSYLANAARQPVEDMVTNVNAALDACAGSIRPKDDVTILACEIA